jgi:hypothetical protein
MRKLEELEVKIVSVRISMAVLICTLIVSAGVQAVVFINEVFTNPPGPTDMDREFIELMGTPGMKLDGYAIAVLNGTQSKFYPLGSIPPVPVPAPEIDEFFSLDGLTLGNNGLLALLVRNPDSEYFTNILSDSHWVLRSGLWNGGLDVPGSIKDDGSTTIVLIRNRPGRTQADPCNPNGLRWGKAILHDDQLKILDNNDQWGDGDLDEGEPNGLGGYTLDMCGTSTPFDANDDLEIVDEVSFENDNGWEYDTDDRHVDEGSTHEFLPHRHVHALDDPGGFTPNAISRVDYRTKGIGWTPGPNATGEMANGNNWQDTATEQWVRGNVVYKTVTFVKHYYYENTTNPIPSLQPYMTNVPLWLDDDIGQDYDFSTAYTYEIAEGRINPLSIPFIPGDCDRDGVCDANDIAKIKAVFGDNDWIFANSCPDACETDFGDPTTQTRPWDVDATGDNGIEATDLQWTLNFQGNSNGKIVGIKYDSNTIPASTGVYLDSNAVTGCTVTTSVNVPSGHTLTTLRIGDIVEVTVKGQVTAGPNTTSGRENGIMQYIHDLGISTTGILKVTSIEALGSFSKTRAPLEYKLGTNGDLGVELINGYTTSFTQGLSGPNNLYRVTMQALGLGSANVTIQPSQDAAFANSTPKGLKIGHTKYNGDPNSSNYPALLAITVAFKAGDLDSDGDVDFRDFAILANQWRQSPGSPSADIAPPGGNGVVDLFDLDVLADDWLAGT